MAPQNAERVEHNGVSDCELVRIGNDLTGVVDNGIDRQTPGLVVEDSLTVLTGRLRVVPVAVIRDGFVVEHEFSSFKAHVPWPYQEQ